MELTETSDHRVAFITCPDSESANKLADLIIDRQAAACVNIVPGLTSVYRWKGEVCRDSELLLVVKTRQEKREELAAVVAENHPYTEPELIFLPITSGSQTYLEWVTKHVQS